MSAFLESVQRDGCEGRRSLLFSVVSDKRAERMAEQILKSGLFSRIAAAPMESGRSVTKEQLDNIWKGRAELHDSPEEAFATLIGARGEKDMVLSLIHISLCPDRAEGAFNVKSAWRET